MKEILVCLCFLLFCTCCSLSKACEPIKSMFSSETYFKPQRCYEVPDLTCAEPIHAEFLPNSEQECIYVEYFVIGNDYALKFSYCTLDQLNWFGVAVNEFIYIDTNNDGEFDTEYDITECIDPLVPDWAKTYVGPSKHDSCEKN